MDVLIVPLWNWNRGLPTAFFLALPVLIVPLWNWNLRYPNTKLRKKSSNCTFMELKLDKEDNRSIWAQVLIVPLWNWNYLIYFNLLSNLSVLIVPLWNWNLYAAEVCCTMLCSNCTFMELKLSFCWYCFSRSTF